MADKMKRLYIFGLDAVNRFTAEMNLENITYTGDASRIRNKLSYTADAVVFCYMGDQDLSESTHLTFMQKVKHIISYVRIVNDCRSCLL